MPKLVCQDCGEVLEEDLTEQEAQNAKEQQQNVHDHRDEQENDSQSDENSDGSGAGGLQDRDDADEIEDQVEGEFDDKLDEIDDDEKVEDSADDVEDYANAAEDTDLGDLDVEVGKDHDVDTRRWESAKRTSDQLAQIFRDQLRQKQKNQIHREQRSGRFDSRRMIEADRGSAKVFKREDEGRDLEYETYFVLDRSGSMNGSKMRYAENAVATLMLALEKTGIKTELLDFKQNTPRVIKTKSQDAVDENGGILAGPYETGGGTPLSEVMKLIEGRLEGTHGEPFVVVVTDGKPNSESAYIDAIEQINAPILGVTIGAGSKLDASTRDRLFNFHVEVTNEAELTDKMFDLASGVML